MNTARMGGHPCTGARLIKGWQDLCAVHDLRASDGEKPLWWQDVRAAYSPTALCGAFWIHDTHILPKLAESEYMAAIYCHELVIFPSEAPSGTHQGDILPRPAARERIRAISRHGPAARERIGAISCHVRQPGNASERYIAMAMRQMIATEAHRWLISDCNGVGCAGFIVWRNSGSICAIQWEKRPSIV